MGRRGRKHRKAQDKAVRKEKAKLLRKQQLADERIANIAEIKRRVRRAAHSSSDGRARAKHSYTVFTRDGCVHWNSVRLWEDMNEWEIRSLMNYKWIPNKPLTPLEKLARCAN